VERVVHLEMGVHSRSLKHRRKIVRRQYSCFLLGDGSVINTHIRFLLFFLFRGQDCSYQGVGERTIARRVRKSQTLSVYRRQIVIIHDNVVPFGKFFSLCDVLGDKYGLARALVSPRRCVHERAVAVVVVKCSIENSAQRSSSCLCVASSRLLLSCQTPLSCTITASSTFRLLQTHISIIDLPSTTMKNSPIEPRLEELNQKLATNTTGDNKRTKPKINFVCEKILVNDSITVKVRHPAAPSENKEAKDEFAPDRRTRSQHSLRVVVKSKSGRTGTWFYPDVVEVEHPTNVVSRPESTPPTTTSTTTSPDGMLHNDRCHFYKSSGTCKAVPDSDG